MIKSKYINSLLEKNKQNVKTIVLPEGEDERVLTAAHIVSEMKAAKPVILGDEDAIKAFYAKNGWTTEGIQIIKPENSPKLKEYTDLLYNLRKEKGLTPEDAAKLALNYNYFGTLMIKAGDADGMVSGANHSTADTVRPALQIIKSAKKGHCASSFFIMISNDVPYIFSDCGVVINPTDQELADIALDAAETAIQFGIEPNVAMLSFSTKGSAKGDEVDKVKRGLALAQEALKSDAYKNLNIQIDGELQADAALDSVVAAKKAPGSPVAGKAKVLIFPSLEAGNICYKLLQRLGGCEAYGPILQGLNAPVNDLSRGCFAEDIVGAIAITSIQATK
ncbi:MAG: phosphate acetyltransferase [Alphaproteobacteria bacterium]|nr:phosphate acetyltransferase [Alphaproteobacteria bacterium]